ncbi:amidohydrolase family protein [Nocardia huaxiensis]|uniref:Amidohydrolase n=1 Tax=Nocardia huaxiensis TaxID=2755382 RepID=A0A7D6ZD48_9NOCA|nr:amidohydrolase family protein [Nocardia huaxiensis]QLY28059.1 amidohydrolase [Nocardia huaxiensis]UFS98505.1 amidohydrolase family protein [Nocardia huaxiensis]
MTRTIDAWAQHPNARFVAQPWLSTLLRWTRQTMSEPPPVSATLAAMDEAGVDQALLCSWFGPNGPLIDNDETAAHVRAHPDRFVGVASVDLRYPVQAVRELRRAVNDLGMVALRVVPWLWNLPPDDRRYYPLLAECVELNIPFCTQIGHTGPLCPSEPGRPIPYLDTVLLEFPDLVVVGGHVGYPWIDEVLSLAMKYPNFYVDTSAYAVHRLPQGLVDYLRGPGRTRVLFGTNWPMLSAERCLRKLDELHLDDETRALFLGGNAARVFGL